MPLETLEIEIKADTQQFHAGIAEAGRAAASFTGALSGAFEDAIVQGKGLSDVLRNLALDLSRQAFRSSFRPLEGLLTGGLNTALGGFGDLLKGAVGGIVPFARGGVVDAPSLFPLGGRLGLAGEAGPEAILPLQRGSDGRLGIAAQGGGTTNITLNVTARDAESFQRSQPQIEAMLARAVARGQRNL